MKPEIDIEASFCEMLDEIYPVVKIGKLTFYPSNILKTCDSIAYYLSLDEHRDYLHQEKNGDN